MNLKSIATLAATLIASTTWAAAPADAKCGAGSCSKKERATSKEAGCSKKESTASPKDASCSKKEASCSKKDASCAKK